MSRRNPDSTSAEKRSSEPVSPRLQAWLGAGLLLWIIGVQTTEAVAATGAGAVTAGLLFALIRSRRGIPASAVRAWWPLLAFVAWGVFATFVNWPLRGTGALARHLDWLFVAVAAAGLARVGPRAWRVLVVVAFAVALLGCAAAAFQYFGLWPRPEAFDPVAWERSTFHRLYEPIPGNEGRYMAVGLHFHRLKFAHVTGVVVVWAVAIGLFAHGPRRWLSLGVAAIGLFSVFVFPYARAAAIAVLVGVFTLLLVLRHARRFAAVLGGALAVAALGVLLFHGSFRERLLSSTTVAGSGNRPHLLAAGANAVRANPILGTGVGKFVLRDWAEADAPASVLEHGGKSHNLLLSTAAEMGLPGLALLLVLWTWMAHRFRRDTVTGAAGLATLVYLTVLGLVHDPLFHAEVSLAFALALGLGLSGVGAREGHLPEASVEPS